MSSLYINKISQNIATANTEIKHKIVYEDRSPIRIHKYRGDNSIELSGE